MRRTPYVFFTALALAACGGDGGSSADTSVTPDTTTESDTVTATLDTGGDAVALATCDGPAGIYVETEAGDSPEVIPYASGDLSIRGYASSCGDDGDVDTFTLRGCLGPLAATLDWTVAASTLDVQIVAPALQGDPLIDSAGQAAGQTLSAELTAPASGELDLQVTVRCREGAPAARSTSSSSTSR